MQGDELKRFVKWLSINFDCNYYFLPFF
jgi:hypothetical protein